MPGSFVTNNAGWFFLGSCVSLPRLDSEGHNTSEISLRPAGVGVLHACRSGGRRGRCRYVRGPMESPQAYTGGWVPPHAVLSFGQGVCLGWCPETGNTALAWLLGRAGGGSGYRPRPRHGLGRSFGLQGGRPQPASGRSYFLIRGPRADNGSLPGQGSLGGRRREAGRRRFFQAVIPWSRGGFWRGKMRATGVAFAPAHPPPLAFPRPLGREALRA